jgi:ribosomal protection tetracycline resistance protein
VLRRTLNLGILAHVDAGKTTLTERLLYATGVIDEIGSVDKGTTQTDSLALEQQRGITIKAAVVSFEIGETTVNLIDTPGHPDFIAEVERVLGVLDGAVLVISAVEGVQPQTRILMRALGRLRIPTLVFVNKIDRVGADVARVVADVRRKLTPAVAAVTSATGEGTRGAAVEDRADGDPTFTSALVDLLGDHDDALLAAYLDDEGGISPQRLRAALAAQTRQALVHPVLCGSAITGAGVDLLVAAIPELLPATAGTPDGDVAGTVFKIERGPTGDRVAYVRMFSGSLRTRDAVRFGRDHEAKVTAISVFERGEAVRRPSVEAGSIAKVWGLAEVQLGDGIGDATGRGPTREFPPPTLESVVDPVDDGERQRLRVALAQLAEQDPLIDVRQDDRRQEISVSLYGEVQKEVVQATLAADYGIAVRFRETTPIYVERPTASGEAVEILHAETNPFLATIGLRVDRAATGSGVDFRLEVDPRTAPLYVYKTLESFTAHMAGYVRDALREGLFGWQVLGCSVTMTRCMYSVPDGPPSRRGPLSKAADFRKLTPIVVMQALEHARTVVCEPTVRVHLEIPADTIGGVMAVLARLDAEVESPTLGGELAVLETVMSAGRARDLQRRLSGLTHGEGVLESAFEGYEPVVGEPPVRQRATPSPLDLDAYVAHVGR